MAGRPRRETRPAPPHDDYLGVRVSNLRHRNRSFREGKRIYDKDSSAHASLRSLHWGQATLQFALSKATEDNTPVSADLVGEILELNELMATAATHDDAARWIHDNLTEPSKGPWTDSTGDCSTDGRRPRPMEDPSSGRRDRKRATVS